MSVHRLQSFVKTFPECEIHAVGGELRENVMIFFRFLGINATDVNVAAGRYSPGQQPPLETGLEASTLGKI